MSQGPAPSSDVRTLSPAELYSLIQELGGQLQRHDTTLTQLSVVVFGDEHLGVLGLKLQMERQVALLEQIHDGQSAMMALINSSLPTKVDRSIYDIDLHKLREDVAAIQRKQADKKTDQRWTLSYITQWILVISSLTGMLGVLYQIVQSLTQVPK